MTKQELIEGLRNIYNDEDSRMDKLRSSGLLTVDDRINHLKRLADIHIWVIGRLVQMVPDNARSKE